MKHPNEDTNQVKKRTRADAIRAIEEAKLLDHDEDVVFSCLDERGEPFAVAAHPEGTDLSLARWEEDDGTFYTTFLDGPSTDLLARALAGRAPPPVPDDRSLLVAALVILDEAASAAGSDPRLSARFGGLDGFRAAIRERVGG